MPKAKYEDIYKDLKRRIEQGEFPHQALLPSENALATAYECTRNTVRRALAQLAQDGYVHPIQGKGVRVIFQPTDKTAFTVGTIESFQESAERNRKTPSTRVLSFAEITADEALAHRTGFDVGTKLTEVKRLRLMDGEPLIIDHNYFRTDLVPGLSVRVMAHSVYAYLEDTLGMTISTSKRTITVELANPIDKAYLKLGEYNCMAVVSSQTFNEDGEQFEYTESRHRPDYFRFQDIATR
ncbi:trehalose operon repressor [Bifidobacterium sp. 64T4]|uniref:trehalose operon repressor n=1 Tax=Bifidobacterium pongonis TaxID=2834432 RepID=UPI001C5A411F|nr:trehalose operon repressor [Bifidobacterium pongonis]MBW3094534.1 trehalose operon repressor [Bifidobacterium pongonis]